MLRTHSVSSRHSAVNLMNDGDLWAGGVGQRIVNGYRYWNAGRVESMSVGDVKMAGREWRAQSPLPRRSRCAFYRDHTSSATTDVLTTCHPPAARRRAAPGSDYFRLSPEIDFGSVLPPTYY